MLYFAICIAMLTILLDFGRLPCSDPTPTEGARVDQERIRRGPEVEWELNFTYMFWLWMYSILGASVRGHRSIGVLGQ